jgi:hypothetical protein
MYEQNKQIFVSNRMKINTYKFISCVPQKTHSQQAMTKVKYWVIQNDCGQVWQLCTKMYVATV